MSSLLVASMSCAEGSLLPRVPVVAAVAFCVGLALCEHSVELQAFHFHQT